MANYIGALTHRHGSDTTTVVDPRFGTDASPEPPVSWGQPGGGGGSSEGVLLEGPYSDWGSAVNNALSTSPVVRIASGLGDIPQKTEIVVPSNRTLEMGRGTRLSITADHFMPTLLNTARKPSYAWIRPDGTSSAWAENIIIRGVSIDGSQMPTVQPNPDGTYWGICIMYARHVLVEDALCTDIQNGNPLWETSCYGIGATEAEHVDFVRCKGWGSGYQNLTVYDGGKHVNFTDCYSGDGWRTGFQIHRNVSDIRVTNLVVRNFHPSAQSCVTLHGQADASAIKRVTFIGIDLESSNPHVLTGRGGMQLVGPTHDLTVIGGRIRSNNYGMHLMGRNIKVIGVDVEAYHNALWLGFDGDSLRSDDMTSMAVADCKFTAWSETIPAVRVSSGSGVGPIDDVRFSNCDIETVGGPGIKLETASAGNHLSGNRIRTTGAGLDLTGTGMAYGNDLTGTTGITGGTGFTLANNVGA